MTRKTVDQNDVRVALLDLTGDALVAAWHAVDKQASSLFDQLSDYIGSFGNEDGRTWDMRARWANMHDLALDLSHAVEREERLLSPR